MLGIKNATLISMSDKYDKIMHNADILIENNKIVKIGKGILNDVEDIKILDATDKVVMPGLINTHSHVPMSIFRETVDGYNLQDWLQKKIWPMEEKFTLVKEDIYNASLLSFLEMIKTGSTTINDMYSDTDEIIKAMKVSGIRLQTTRTLMGKAENTLDLKRIDELKELIDTYKDTDERLTLNIGIHGLYTTYKEYLKKCIEFARKENLPVHIHFCENRKEVEDIKLMYNESPIDVLENEFQGLKVLLAHSVKLENTDIEKLSKINADISISHCPVSNLRLGCGIAKIQKMVKEGINVSLGTDGQGSGSNLDLFETMKYTALLQKGQEENPEALSAYEVLKMATINGAKALGLEQQIGSIEENKFADIIIINTDNILLKPQNDLISQIVYNVKGSDVDTTIIAGNILMENRKVKNINEKELCEKAEKIIERISK